MRGASDDLGRRLTGDAVVTATMGNRRAEDE